MATLPRTAAVAAAAATSRHTYERTGDSFDAGLNTSTAWTEHLDRTTEYGGDSGDEIEEESRPARVLYDFQGKTEFGELTVSAGDILLILKVDLWDGWSLAKTTKQSRDPGLIPREYYVLTADFLPSATVSAFSRSADERAAALAETHKPSIEPLQMQPTGYGYSFPNIKERLLGGMSLNRFSSFVTTGAEDFVLNGAEAEEVTNPKELEEELDPDGDEEYPTERKKTDHHFVGTPPAWKSKSPPFKILVHSPSKRTSSLTGAYTVYAITSLFSVDYSSPSHSRETSTESDTTATSAGTITPPRITVYRRFSQFTFLHSALSRHLPGIALPPLPEKQYAGRFNDDFVEARRGDLERWLNRVVRHPLARYAEVLVFFLGCESDIEWKRELPKFLAAPAHPPGPSFYANVFHPEFNLDLDGATDTVNRFERHVGAVGKSVHALRNVFTKVRENGIATATTQRTLSYALLSLITSTPLSHNPNVHSPSLAYGFSEEDEEDDEENHDRLEGTKGLLNDDGAWCWREHCEECLKLTKGLQRAAESLQSIADLHDDHARRAQFATHDALKDISHPKELYAPVVETHRSTLSRYRSTLADRSGTREQVAARCETVLNTTMAEFDTYHVQKVEDFERIAAEHLDEEIELHEQVLARLRQARSAFGPQADSVLPVGPRQPSIYERDLKMPETIPPRPLAQPAPHVFDLVGKMRPVSVAIRESIGVLFGGGGSAGAGGRGSMFGRLWGT